MFSEIGHRAKKLVLQCINGLSSNPVEGRTQICQLKEIIPTLFGLMFRHIYTSISRFSLRNKVKLRLLKLYFYSGCGRVVQGAGHKAKRLVLQYINGVTSNPVEGRIKM